MRHHRFSRKGTKAKYEVGESDDHDTGAVDALRTPFDVA